MTIFTTFNKDIYDFSGKHLIQSIKDNMPKTRIVAYKEFDEDINVESIDIRAIPTLQQVINDNLDIVHESFGGHATEFSKETFWNTRWPGWFRKIVMAHDVVCNKQHKGYLVFVDSDTRFTKSFDDEFLARVTKNKPISFFKGNRPAIDSGLVIVDNDSPKPIKFYKWFLNMFINRSFRDLDRWDDGYVLTKIIEQCSSRMVL